MNLCVECGEGVAPEETDCSALNCSVVSISPVQGDEYAIDGEYEKQYLYLLFWSMQATVKFNPSFSVLHETYSGTSE